MFSKTYLKQPPGTNQDTDRLRNRLAAEAKEVTGVGHVHDKFVKAVHRETGARVPHNFVYDVGKFFRDAEFRDVLDAVTCMVNGIRDEGRDALAREWIAFCKRAFYEEGMAHRIDDTGEAHYVVDVAFHETANAVIAALSGAKYAAASSYANKAVEQLTKAQPDGKHAIRDIYECVETVFKLAIGKDKPLSESNIRSELTPIVNRQFAGADPIAQGAAIQTVEALKSWADPCHKYRHGQGTAEPVEPPIELSIVLVSNGLNFARWIAQIS